jgi:hypothetical protein
MAITRLLNPRTWLAAAAAVGLLLSISAAAPSVAEAATALTASSGPGCTLSFDNYDWYMEYHTSYSVMMDTSNDTYIAVHQLQRFGNIIWNFCRTGTNHGDPIFKLIDEGIYGTVGDCAADTSKHGYFTFKTCSAAGEEFIERPRAGGKGFRLESVYILDTDHLAYYITAARVANNSRLSLSSGSGQQAWNGEECNSAVDC